MGLPFLATRVQDGDLTVGPVPTSGAVVAALTSLRFVIALSATTGLPNVGTLWAQGIVTLPSRPTCQTCSVRVGHHVVLGDTAGPGELPQPVYFIRKDDKGRFFLSFFTHRPMAFSPEGAFQGFIGQLGDGPGEFRWPLLFHAGNDSLWVADPRNARISLFRWSDSGPSFLTSWPHQSVVPPPQAFVRLPGGDLLVNANIPTRERIGYPLHRLRLDGSTHSFGSSTPAFRPDRPNLNVRAVAPARDGGFWVAHLTRYEIERYDAEGRLVRTWRRPAPWFPPNEGEQAADPDLPPQPRLTAIEEDGEGRLWVLALVPDARHREAFGPSPRPAVGSRERLVDLRDYNRYFDTIIEVLDVRRGVVLSSTRVDPMLTRLLGTHGEAMLAASQEPTSHGGLAIVVRRITPVTVAGGSRP